MDREAEDLINNRLALLEMKVKDLQVELDARKRGQRLAAEENDIYETAWEQENRKLKELLKEAASFIKTIGSDTDEVQIAFLKQIEEAVGRKVGNNEFEDFDTELTIDILGLVVDCEIPYETVACWTREQKMEAEKWAAEQHAIASDNDIPEPLMAKPAHVAQLERDNPKRSELYDVVLTPRERTEAPWATWAKRMKDSPKEWERLHRIELAARHARARYRQPDRDHAVGAMCSAIDAVELERIQEFQGRDWKHGEKKKR